MAATSGEADAEATALEAASVSPASSSSNAVAGNATLAVAVTTDRKDDRGRGYESSKDKLLKQQACEAYEPTEKEIQEYADWLGIDTRADADLLWIATKGLKTPLPEPWRPCESGEGEIFYFNPQTGKSTWDHPCDDELRQLYQRERAKKRGVNINWELADSNDDAESLAERQKKEKQERQERMQKVPRPPAVPKKEGIAVRKSLGTAGGSSSSTDSGGAPPAPPSSAAPVGSLPAPLPPLSLPKGTPLLDLGLPPLEDMPALDGGGLGSPLFKSSSPLAAQKGLADSGSADKASKPGMGAVSPVASPSPKALDGDAASLGEVLSVDHPGPVVGIGGAQGLQRSNSDPGFSRIFDDDDLRSPKCSSEFDNDLSASRAKDKVVTRRSTASTDVGRAPAEIKLKLDRKLQSLHSPEASKNAESMSIVEELGPNSPDSIAELIDADSPGAAASAVAAELETPFLGHSALPTGPRSPSSGDVEDSSLLRKRLQEMEAELKSAKMDKAELEQLRADREAGASTAASLEAELALERSSKRILQSEAAEAAALRKAKAALKDQHAAAARELERAKRENASNLSELSALEWRAAHAEATCEQQKQESQDLKASLELRKEEAERLVSELRAAGSASSSSRGDAKGGSDASATKSSARASSSASAPHQLEQHEQQQQQRLQWQQQQQQNQQQGVSESSSSPPTPQLASILQAELRPEDSKFSLWSQIEDGSRIGADSLDVSSLSAVLETPPEECADDMEDSMVEELCLLKASPGVKERSTTGGGFSKSGGGTASASTTTAAASSRGHSRASTSQPSLDQAKISKASSGKTSSTGDFAPAGSRTTRLSADTSKAGSESPKARKASSQDPSKSQPKPAVQLRSGGLSPTSAATSPSALSTPGVDAGRSNKDSPSFGLPAALSASQDPLGETLHATLRQHTVDVAVLRGDSAEICRRPLDTASRLGMEVQEPPPSPAATASGAAAATAAAASSAAALREARREAQKAKEAAQAAEELLQETRTSLEQERSARESLREKASEAQRELASLRARLKGKEVECERMSLECQRHQADLAEREVENNQLLTQLQARESELGQLRQQRRTLTQQSETEMQRQRFELGAREQVLNDRERFLQERENLAGEAEVMLHKRRRELQADMQRAELAGLRATVAELGGTGPTSAPYGGDCQDPVAKRPRDNTGARRSSSARSASARRALSAERRPSPAGVDALMPQRSTSVTRSSTVGAGRAAAGREVGAEGRRGSSSPRWQVPLVLASSEESTPPRESLHAVEGVSPSSPSSDGSLRQLAPDCGGVGSSTEAGLLGNAAPSPSPGPAGLDLVYFKKCPLKELAELLRVRRRELRSEHATLEDERRRWRHEAREARRGSTQGDTGIAHLAEARNDLDARAAALNRSIADYRTLEQLLAQRQRAQGAGGAQAAAAVGAASGVMGAERGGGVSDDEAVPSGRRPSKVSLQHSTHSSGSAQRSVSSPGMITGPSAPSHSRRGERGSSSRGGYPSGGSVGRGGLPGDGVPMQYMLSLSGGDLGTAPTPRGSSGSFRRAGSECHVPRVAEQRAALAPAGGA